MLQALGSQVEGSQGAARESKEVEGARQGAPSVQHDEFKQLNLGLSRRDGLVCLGLAANEE